MDLVRINLETKWIQLVNKLEQLCHIDWKPSNQLFPHHIWNLLKLEQHQQMFGKRQYINLSPS